MMGVIPNMKNLRKRRNIGTTLHLPAKVKEKVKENVTETVNVPAMGVGIPCHFVRGST